MQIVERFNVFPTDRLAEAQLFKPSYDGWAEYKRYQKCAQTRHGGAKGDVFKYIKPKPDFS
jgi:hypothetical protein